MKLIIPLAIVLFAIIFVTLPVLFFRKIEVERKRKQKTGDPVALEDQIENRPEKKKSPGMNPEEREEMLENLRNFSLSSSKRTANLIREWMQKDERGNTNS